MLFYAMFSRLSRMPTCDRRKNTQRDTRRCHIPR